MPDKNIDVGKLKLEPFNFEAILEVRLEKELNEHAGLYLRGVILDEKEIAPALDSGASVSVAFSNGGEVYFRGVIKNIGITCRNAVYTLEIYALSNTSLLDAAKHKRSFQEEGMAYEDIVKYVIKDGGGVIKGYSAEKLTVNQEKQKILLQYNETDWEFSKRLASHTNSVLLPVASSAKPEFDFGAPGGGGKEIIAKNYTFTKDLDLYRSMSREEKPFEEKDAIVYTVETDDFLDYSLGDKVTFKGESLFVRRLFLNLTDASLVCSYELVPEKAMAAPKAYNREIIGLTLDGTVLKAENDEVKLNLSIDKERGEGGDEAKARLFSYATGYSAENHTGWYVMPEVDDAVQLYFPMEDEHFAYASQSVRQKKDETTGNLKVNAPVVKFLRTPFGKEIKLDEKEILITAKDETTFIRINEETGIVIETPHPILIKSGSTIDITSEDDMTITTNKNLLINAEESITITNKHNSVKTKPDSGIAISTDKEMTASSKENMAYESKKEVSVTSGKDMTLKSGKKMAGSAQSSVELSASGSSVKIDGNVDLKGKLVRLN